MSKVENSCERRNYGQFLSYVVCVCVCGGGGGGGVCKYGFKSVCLIHVI